MTKLSDTTKADRVYRLLRQHVNQPVSTVRLMREAGTIAVHTEVSRARSKYKAIIAYAPVRDPKTGRVVESRYRLEAL